MNKKSVASEVESLARQVEAHPDYRVVRRLDTTAGYPRLSGSTLSRAVILDTYDGLEDPGMAIPPTATAVHGITDGMAAGPSRLGGSRIGEV